MSGITLTQFQDQVSELLLRHRSLLDVLSKSQQTEASVNRSVIKAVTECGCVRLNAEKQPYTEGLTLEEAKRLTQTHLSGELCEHCVDLITAELGKHMFYVAALCNVLGLSLEDIVSKESQTCNTLGLFNMS
jgi:predicted house-cleaning noncanonical NTP pyrophosphatase (MazG superfamily)